LLGLSTSHFTAMLPLSLMIHLKCL